LGGYTMVIAECMSTCWRNTKSLPFLFRLFIQGAMVATPILLLFLVLPITEWEVNGRMVSYTELWSSGEGAAAAVSLALAGAGAWGLAARRAESRWLLVISPVAPYIVLAIFSASAPVTLDVIVSAVLTAAVFYFCLFRLRAVRAYLDAELKGSELKGSASNNFSKGDDKMKLSKESNPKLTPLSLEFTADFGLDHVGRRYSPKERVMTLELTRQFLGTSTLGMVGAGHLAKAIALGLLEAGLPKHNLAICHRGSKETDRELSAAGLVERVVDKDIVTRGSRILLYLVRPQDVMAIQGADFRDDGIFISFLAGVPLKNLPVSIADTQRFRVMPSAPDTLRQRNGIAALYPADNPLVREILESLGLRVVALKQESDIHAFTALGPCLPIALTYWEGLGNKSDEAELLDAARKFGLPSYDSILRWAHSVRPRGLSND